MYILGGGPGGESCRDRGPERRRRIYVEGPLGPERVLRGRFEAFDFQPILGWDLGAILD